MPSSHQKRFGVLAGIAATAALAGFAVQPATAQNVPLSAPVSIETIQETGITMPLKEWSPVFKYQGVIKQVTVKEGDSVIKGQLLLEQETGEDQVELEADQALAKSTAAVDSAKAALVGRKADLISKQAEYGAKKKEYQRVKKILDDGGGNDFEVDKAKYEMEAADAAIDAARGMISSAEADIEKAAADQTQAAYKAKHQLEHLKALQILAQEDGVVQAVNVQPGDAADPNRQTTPITIVKVDVLKVEFHLPAVEAEKLKAGQKLRITYDHKEWDEATITKLPPVGLASANGLTTIHMELPNPKGRIAGQSIYIELPPEIVTVRNDQATAALK
jgi:multidrug efflux pump subunit AcrA (membrane-fusion protein)